MHACTVLKHCSIKGVKMLISAKLTKAEHYKCGKGLLYKGINDI